MKYLLAIAAALLFSSVAQAQSGVLFPEESRNNGTYNSSVVNQRMTGLYVSLFRATGAGTCTLNLQAQDPGIEGFFTIATSQATSGTPAGDFALYPGTVSTGWSTTTTNTYVPSFWRAQLVIAGGLTTCYVAYQELP